MACGAALALAPSPALAESDLPADIAAPLRAAKSFRTETTGRRDEQFTRLFRDWRSLDSGGGLSSDGDDAAVGSSIYLARSLARSTSMTAARVGSAPSSMPLKGLRLTSAFGNRRHPILGGYRAHDGIDLAAPTGTPVRATGDGVVATADWTGGYGLLVALNHGGGMQTRYGHMSKLAVAAGQRVKKGDVVGYVGSTGRSTGPHLHYEVRVNGRAVDPLAAERKKAR